MEYRKEIDGLRAIAVLPVIFFHAGFQTFSGGFIGVDVFFVISGYLITSIILAEKKSGTFSLLNFYERRIRRIFPALCFVMLSCIFFAWLFLFPADFRRFSQSLIAVSTFSSNILFWKTSGYFEAAAELKPLLHTWSLAVEEQYYLLFPLFLNLTWKLGKNRILILLITIAALSLVITQVGSFANSFTFYLLPSRAWELLIGSFIAFYYAGYCKPISNKALIEIGGITGLAMILYSVFIFDKKTPSPSLYTLIPTIGTGLVILFATSESFVGKILTHKILVGTGLISYSAYLWHQPLFAFAKHITLNENNPALFAFLSATTFLLAYFTWKYIETPFRSKQKFDRKQIFACYISASTFFIFIGAIGHITNGFEFRLDSTRREFLNAILSIKPDERNECNFYEDGNGHITRKLLKQIPSYCYEKSPDAKKIVLLWGDSHAKHLYAGLNKILSTNWQILQLTTNDCEPKLDALPNTNDYCEYSNWVAHKTIVESKPDFVIIAQNLNQNINSMKNFESALSPYIGKKIMFLGPVPHWKEDLPEIIVKKIWRDSGEEIPNRSFIGVDTELIKRNELLKKNFISSNSSIFVSTMDYFCDQNGCRLYEGDNIKTGLISKDYGHLTPIASYYFAQNVLTKIMMN